VPTTRVYTIADIYADPHFQARDMLQQVPHPVLGHTTQTGVVPRLSATPGGIQPHRPRPGRQHLDIRSDHDLGLAPRRIDDWPPRCRACQSGIDRPTLPTESRRRNP
jgi:crotonobetainyl-CoA:carnitine CoA-transferase CaiB-like acyl-CoA transferase